MTRAALSLLAVAILAAGCATPGPDDSALNTNTLPTAGDEDQARARARIHTELAAGYFDLGNMAVALQEVKEALSADSNYGPAYNVAGLIYGRLREDRLAEESFQRALRINPSDYDSHNNYGSFLCERKREREAIHHFTAAVRNPLYRTPDRSYVNAGVCARRSGDVAGATGFFELAIKANPRQPRALYQLADIAYQRGDITEAKSYLASLAQLGADAPEVLWLGLRVARRQGDRNVEASYARQLRRKFPNSREARALNAGQYE